MGKKLHNTRWMRLVDWWEEIALVNGVREARKYVVGPNEQYSFVEAIYMNGWTDRILGALPPHDAKDLYMDGYTAAEGYFRDNPPPQPIAAKPMPRRRFG